MTLGDNKQKKRTKKTKYILSKYQLQLGQPLLIPCILSYLGMFLSQKSHLMDSCDKSYMEKESSLQLETSFRSRLPETNLIQQIINLQRQLTESQLENIRLKQESFRLESQLLSHKKSMQLCIQKDVRDNESLIHSQISFTASIKPACRNSSSKNNQKVKKLVGPTQKYCSAQNSPIRTPFRWQRSSKDFCNPSLKNSRKFCQISQFTPSTSEIECEKECWEMRRVPGKIRSTVRADDDWRCRVARATIDQIWNAAQ